MGVRVALLETIPGAGPVREFVAQAGAPEPGPVGTPSGGQQ
jgi:hypothetical protein